MASIRDRIIDALFAALQAAGAPAGLLVTEERTHPAEQEELPMIGLYFEDEEPIPLLKQEFKAPIVQKVLGVTLEYRALASVAGQPPVAPRKVIDPLYLWAWQQIRADETFGGLAMGVIEGPTKWLSKEGDAIVAAAAQKIVIRYRTSRLDPTSPS